MSCQYCKDLNNEKEKMKFVEIYIQRAGCYDYECPIKYCPNCGKILNRYKENREE
jgi:Fe-S cluster assembly iron-binding protein IscA